MSELVFGIIFVILLSYAINSMDKINMNNHKYTCPTYCDVDHEHITHEEE
jgi:hypothetical protein